MIKDRSRCERCESEMRRREVPDYMQNLRLLEALYEEARFLGHFSLSDPLEGLDVKIRIARVINVSTAPGEDRSRS